MGRSRNELTRPISPQSRPTWVFGDARHAHRLDELVHRTPLNIGFLDVHLHHALYDVPDPVKADAGWAPLLPTPNHPEYPAAHTCSDGSLAEGLRQFYHTKNIHFLIDSGVPGLLHPVHQFNSTDDFVEEVGEARVFGGMHYRSSTRDGAKLGKRTTEWIGERFFRPVEGESDR